MTPNKKISPYVWPLLKFKGDIKINTNITSKVAINACSAYFGVDESDILSPASKRSIVHARQCVMYILCFHSTMSLREIGELFLPGKGNRQVKYSTGKNHSTVIWGRERIKGLMKVSADSKAEVNKLLSICFSNSVTTIRDLSAIELNKTKKNGKKRPPAKRKV